MRVPAAAEVLSAWEQGSGLDSAEQALRLLALALPEEPAESLAALPVGEREGRLLELREALFGSTLTAVAACEACGEDAELSIDASELRRRLGPARAPRPVTVDGYRVRFRLPTTADLSAAARAGHPEGARVALLERSVVGAEHGGATVAATDLPEAVVAAVAERMQAADPLGDVRISTQCPACGHRWDISLEVAAFLWREIESWAHRALSDVHALASAFGWREADILAMTPRRRAYYLELVNG
jgi:hypothetical protein